MTSKKQKNRRNKLKWVLIIIPIFIIIYILAVILHIPILYIIIGYINKLSVSDPILGRWITETGPYAGNGFYQFNSDHTYSYTYGGAMGGVMVSNTYMGKWEKSTDDIIINLKDGRGYLNNKNSYILDTTNKNCIAGMCMTLGFIERLFIDGNSGYVLNFDQGDIGNSPSWREKERIQKSS